MPLIIPTTSRPLAWQYRFAPVNEVRRSRKIETRRTIGSVPGIPQRRDEHARCFVEIDRVHVVDVRDWRIDMVLRTSHRAPVGISEDDTKVFPIPAAPG